MHINMKFTELANNRYTTKKYNADKKIPESQIEDLKEILRLSPSSINSQPWKFVFVSKEEVKGKLAEVSFFNEHKVKDASHVVVFCALNDISKFEKQIEENLPEGAVGYYNLRIKPSTEAEIKTWIEHQVYISLGFFLSACASMGIDSTPMEGIDKKEYTRILKLDGYKAMFAVAIGYRDEEDPNQPSQSPKSRLDLDKIIETL
jgi:nitroreductase / dihydropteridine reductase